MKRIICSTYRDCDGDLQKYSDWGVELIEDIDKNRAIVRSESTGKYTTWSKYSNRPFSRIDPDTNEYKAIWYSSLDEVKR